MPLFEYADTPGETALTCPCNHTCGPGDTCTICQPQPSLRRCRACKRGGTIIVEAPPPMPIEPPEPGNGPPIMPPVMP